MNPKTLLAILASLLLLAGAASATEESDGNLEETTEVTTDDCAPTEFSAEALGVVVHLQWSDVEDASGYNIYRAKADGEMRLVILMEAGSNETIDTQVEGGVVYTYAITATVDGNETAPCGVVEVLTNADPCHPGLSVTAQAGPQNRLTWTMVTVAEGYNVYRSGGEGQPHLLAELDANAGGYVDADVKAGKTYTYEVRVVIDGEERPACEPVEVTTIPVFPTALVAALAALGGVGAYVVLRRRA